MKVVLSIGGGRLHLVNSANALAKAGVQIRLVMGWVPKKVNGILVRLASRLFHRDISKGLSARMSGTTATNIELRTQTFIDFFENFIRFTWRVFSASQATRDYWKCFCWRLIGFGSRRFLKNDVRIFHVRSGAGQGGAIRKAKSLGMRVVCDHSIAHPAFMDKHLRAEYEKNGAMFDLGMDSPFWRQIVKDCEESDVVLVNSFFVKDTFVENGFDPEKIKVVYLGQREDFFGLRQKKLEYEVGVGARPLKLLFTGGFGFRKGGEYILEALKILKQRGVAFEMDVVGAFASARQLIARYESDLDISYASNSSHSSHPSNYSHSLLTFHGPKPQDELKSFLANGDVYVFPSLAEGCAQSGMEAMAAGMCVVGTHEAGFPITDGETGYVVPSKDAVAIADRIEWLAKNCSEIDRVGANAAKLIRENYTWEKYAANVKGLYEELLSK